MRNEMKEFLTQLIAFKSVSADKNKAKDSRNALEFLKIYFEEINLDIFIAENEKKNNNPLLFGKIGDNPDKKTILFYSHYDVQPAEIEDGWDTDPFVLIEKDDGYLYGRGTHDDKGPIAATFFAIKELLSESEELPVNIRLLYEGEEESSSRGFEETVLRYRNFFGIIDGIIILDTSWFTDSNPSLDYGYRGIVYMGIEVTGLKQDQHSGLIGGSVREPMTDLIYLLSRLIDVKTNQILINGFYDKVKPLKKEEEALYDNLDFSLDEYKKNLGIKSVLIEDSKQTLMNTWRNPSLSIHGIEGAFSGSGTKTVIPGSVIGKISMRIVPDQTPEEIFELFTNHIQQEVQLLDSPNQIKVKNLGTGNWWYGDVTNFLFQAGKSAIKEYWKQDPSYARSGGSIPIINFMEKTFNAPAMALGIGQPSDGAHSQNERIRIKNLIGGKEIIKLILKNLLNKI